ncbi:AbrB/MazE/SpoVT family DNA-binding domain-containing protein [Candidatus Microgenomates bacterium]|nr:AbrB/MazE/SpoVT family DNA-binding domain-containing protein [Candidatus Microgenomates bacterium]
MTTKVQKWGNSLAVRLPKDIAEHYHLSEGVAVTIVAGRKHIVVQPIRKKNTTLVDLVKKISPQNLPEHISWGDAKGKEVW